MQRAFAAFVILPSRYGNETASRRKHELHSSGNLCLNWCYIEKYTQQLIAICLNLQGLWTYKSYNFHYDRYLCFVAVFCQLFNRAFRSAITPLERFNICRTPWSLPIRRVFMEALTELGALYKNAWLPRIISPNCHACRPWKQKVMLQEERSP